MSPFKKAWTALRALWRGRRLDAEMDEEMRTHLEMRTQANIKAGMSREEAHYTALRQFGWVESLKETCREQRGAFWLEQFIQDVRYGLRILRKNAGFTTLTVTVLALGIGVNTAIFSLADTFLLRLLPIEQPHRFFFISPAKGRDAVKTFNYVTFEHLRDHAKDSVEVAAYRGTRLRTEDGGSRRLVNGQLISGNFFSTLGIHPMRGRFISPQDDRVGAEPVVVVTHRYAQKHFGQGLDVIGKSVEFNGVLCMIVGVTPPGFFGVDAAAVPEVFAAIGMQPRLEPANADQLTSFGLWPFTLVARLQPRAERVNAAAELTVLFQQILAERGREFLREADVRDIPNTKIVLILGSRGTSKLSEQLSEPFFILIAATSLVLLIACANVANLLLGRLTSRGKEFALRLAAGATRMRLVRQLVVESALIGILGAVFGTLLGLWSKRFLSAFFSVDIGDFAAQFGFDGRLICFTTAVSVLAVALFGIFPALGTTRIELAETLKSSARNLSASSARLRLNRLLVVGQVTLSTMVLVGSGLFVRTMWELKHVNLGFNPENLIFVTVKPAVTGYDGNQLDALLGKLVGPEMLARFESLPGVKSASICSSKPIADLPYWYGFLTPLDGSFEKRANEKIYVSRVSSAYFKTLEIGVQKGRTFNALDRNGAPPVAIINETLAKKHFGNQNPLGKRFALSSTPFNNVEIVGVAQDSKARNLRTDSPNLLYMPFAQFPDTEEMKFAVRLKGNPATGISQIRREIEGADHSLALDGIETAHGLIDATLANERSIAASTSLFALLGLLLAVIGLYGVLALSVSRRNSEIGIRMALGADRAKVLRMFLGQGLGLALTGIVFGVAGSLVLARLVAARLFGVAVIDPVTLAGVSILLVVTALLACWLPAAKATKIDPIAALRCE